MAGTPPDVYDIISDSEADEQHKKLFAKYEELMRSTDRSISLEELTHLLDDLDAFTKTHFVTEEDLFTTYAYPEAAAHVAEHRQFTHNLLGARLRLATGDTVDATLHRTSRSLLHWLVKHVSTTDVAAGEYIRSRHAEKAQG